MTIVVEQAHVNTEMPYIDALIHSHNPEYHLFSIYWIEVQENLFTLSPFYLNLCIFQELPAELVFVVTALIRDGKKTALLFISEICIHRAEYHAFKIIK
jgi:hypothetical protein